MARPIPPVHARYYRRYFAAGTSAAGARHGAARNALIVVVVVVVERPRQMSTAFRAPTTGSCSTATGPLRGPSALGRPEQRTIMPASGSA